VLGLSDELVKHALSYFEVRDQAGGVPRPAGVLRVTDMTEVGRQRLAERLRNESRPHGIMLIEGEDVDYTPIASKLDDAQFVEQRRLASQEVARVFRIPPRMIGAPSDDPMTYSNVEQAAIEFVRYSLTPWLRRIELAVSNDRDLAFARQFIRFEVDGLLRSDAKTRAEIYEKALDPVSGWLDVNEVRALEDLPPRQTPPPIQQTVERLLARPPEVAVNGNQET
jgi:HK97 family phage portal protein